MAILPAGLAYEHFGGILRGLAHPCLYRVLADILKGPTICGPRHLPHRPSAGVDDAERCDDVLGDRSLKNGVVVRLVHEGIMGSDVARWTFCMPVGGSFRGCRRAGAQRRVEVLSGIDGIGGVILGFRNVENDGGPEVEDGREVLGLGRGDLGLA